MLRRPDLLPHSIRPLRARRGVLLLAPILIVSAAALFIFAHLDVRRWFIDDDGVAPDVFPLFGKLPTYYINLSGYTDRETQVRAILDPTRATRIAAVNGTNQEEVLKYFDPKSANFTDNMAQYLYDRYTCVPGQLGNYLSHLIAMRQAFEDGHDYVVIVEDDVSDHYARLWPLESLDTLIVQANTEYPDWSAIRLQWHDYAQKVEKAHADWIDTVGAILSSYRKSDRSFALSLNDNDNSHLSHIPLIMPYDGGWGNMATIWSRAGLRSFLDLYTSETDKTKFHCLDGRDCAADLSFWKNSNTLVTVPPLIGPRVLGKSTAEIRKTVIHGDHANHHRRGAAAQLLWLMELNELLERNAKPPRVFGIFM